MSSDKGTYFQNLGFLVCSFFTQSFEARCEPVDQISVRLFCALKP